MIFDSTVTPGDAAAVYMRARAEQAGVDGLASSTANRAGQGIPAWGAERVTAPAKHRLYRAIAGEQTMLGPGERKNSAGLVRGGRY